MTGYSYIIEEGSAEVPEMTHSKVDLTIKGTIAALLVALGFEVQGLAARVRTTPIAAAATGPLPQSRTG